MLLVRSTRPNLFGGAVTRSLFVGTSFCRSYSINITEARRSNLGNDVDSKVPQNMSISQYLKEYKEWYPSDQITNSLIDSYERLKTYPQETIKIGVLYHNEKVQANSKLIETILSDPLASNNQVWFNRVLNRNKLENNTFEYHDEPDIDGISHIYRIPSPILNSITRPKYMNPETTITLNDLIFYEINDLQQFHNVHACHFFIYVTNKITSPIKLPENISDRILLTIIDNNDFTPSSSESTPVPIKYDGSSQIIKINTEKSCHGIEDFLINDTKASNNYLQSLVDSNIFQFVKIIGYNLQIEQLINWNLTKLMNNLSRDEITVQELESLYNDLRKTEINKFNALMHSELQNGFIPNITKFFNKKLRWWKLYYKNDNVEYDLKDFLQFNFMPESIDNYNYLRGKIVTQLQNHKYGRYDLDINEAINLKNPLTKLKEELINQRITTEVQPVVTSNLFYAFLYYQLPTSLLSVCAYQIFEFSFNSSLSIFALGMVMGFNYLSKNWEKFIKVWLDDLFEETRICIDKDCVENGLIKELTLRYNEEKQLINVKRSILNGINGQLKK